MTNKTWIAELINDRFGQAVDVLFPPAEVDKITRGVVRIITVPVEFERPQKPARTREQVEAENEAFQQRLVRYKRLWAEKHKQEGKKGMNIKNFDTVGLSESGVDFALIDPHTVQPSEAIVRLAGPDSSTYREAEKRALRLQAARLRSEGTDTMVAMSDDERVELLASCVLGWRGLTENDQELPFSPENARRVLTSYPVIRRQIDGFVSNAANFLASVKKTSEISARGE
jgi:hypothetical protein